MYRTERITEGVLIIKNSFGAMFHCDQSSSKKGCGEGQMIHELHSAVGLCCSHGGKNGEMKVLDLSVRAGNAHPHIPVL